MIDVLVTQHSNWTARRVRRAMFGQSLVDFKADPWVAVKSQCDSKAKDAKKKAVSKQSRLEREFSQAESQFSQATTIVQSTPVSEDDSSSEEMPAGTVYFATDSSSFQDFSAFQKQDFQYQSFQMNNIQFSTEPFQEEPIFPGFLGPQDSSSFLDFLRKR